MGKLKKGGSKKKPLSLLSASEPSPTAAVTVVAAAPAPPALAPGEISATTLAPSSSKVRVQGPTPDSHNTTALDLPLGPSSMAPPGLEPNSGSGRDASFRRSQQFPPPPLAPGQADHRFNVFIKGLEPDMDSRTLFELFKPFGYILSCKAVIDLSTGLCRGHGFVLYENEASVREARRALTPLGYYVAVAFDHVSFKHFENTGVMSRPEELVASTPQEDAPKIDDDSEFPSLPSSRHPRQTTWSAAAQHNTRPTSTDSSSTGTTPGLSNSSSVSSPRPDHLRDPSPTVHATATAAAAAVSFPRTPISLSPAPPLPRPPNMQPYSEPLNKALFGFDSGFFGSQVGMQTFGGHSGIHSSIGAAAGINSSFVYDRRLSLEAPPTTSLRDHSEEALYRDRDSRTLYIQNLDLDCNDQKLWRICSEFGVVVSAKAIVDPWTGICEGHGFVTFDTELTAVRTLRAMRARGYVANLPDEAVDPPSMEQPLYSSDLYQISNGLSDGVHGPLDVLLTDYLHQLASDPRTQEHSNHQVGFNQTPRSLRSSSGDLQPFFDGTEKDGFLEEPLVPEDCHLDIPIVQFCHLSQGVQHRHLFELCALYGPLVLHQGDFETMNEVCKDGMGQVQFMSLQDACKAIDSLSQRGYNLHLERLGRDSTALETNSSGHVLSQMQGGDPFGHDETGVEMMHHGQPFPTRRPMLQQEHETATQAGNIVSSPSPPSPPVVDCATTITASSPEPKNGSIKIKAFSFADAVKKASTAVLPPTPPPSAQRDRKAPAAAANGEAKSDLVFGSKLAFRGAEGTLPSGASASASAAAGQTQGVPMIRMPIPSDDDDGGEARLTKMGDIESKLEKNEYRMNLFVRDLESTMTDLKLYEICVQFGRVLSCRVVKKHGACSGLGFVMFTTQESAEKARMGLKRLGYHAHVAGHAATTKLRCKTMSETVFLMNLPTFVKEYHIREMFKHYGIVTCNILMDLQTGKGRGVGFLKLRDLETAERFIHENHGRLMGKDWKLPLQVLPARR